MLRGGLLAGAGVATAGAMSAILTGTAKASTPSPQYGWGYCKYCATMWWTPGESSSFCAAYNEANHGVGSGSYNYGLYNGISGLVNSSNPQPGWHWCKACQGLFWGGFSGVCRATYLSFGPHVPGGTVYDLYFNTTGQPYWRWCKECSLLYWQGSSGSTAGYCPAGIAFQGFGYSTPVPGSPHIAGSATVYDIGWGGTY